jgi:predicted anti-sigma-YlaC factor YlaD
MSVVEISCIEVWQAISDLVDREVAADLQARMEAHFRSCAHCKAVYDGTKNVVKLIGDGVEYQVPDGFSARLHQKITEK